MRAKRAKNFSQTVLMTDGLSKQDRYELCVRAENILLPKNGYFGLSAATGGLAGKIFIILDLEIFQFFVVFNFVSKKIN